MSSSDNIKKAKVGQDLKKSHKNDFFLLLDKQKRIVKSSDSFYNVTGWGEDQILGHRFSDFIENQPGQNFNLDKPLEKKLAMSADIVTKVNGKRTFELELTPLEGYETMIIAKDKHTSPISNLDMEMEELLSLFVKNSPAALAMLDKDMNYIITSDRWIKDYNLTCDNLCGLNHYEVFSSIPQRWKDIHQRCLDGAIEKNEDDYFLDNDGKIVWNKWEIHPWRNNKGEIGGIIMFTEVTTKTKEAELKFSDLAKNPMVGVFILQDNQLVFTNSSICETIGYSDEELRGIDDIYTLLSNEDKNIISEKVELVMKGMSEEVHVEFKFNKKDGSILWSELYGSRTIYNSRPALIGTLTDITDRKLREVKTERQIELFKELSFIVSHQLRHEYVKLHGLVNLINLKQINDPQMAENLSKSLHSFTKVDQYIMALNEKLESLNTEE